MDAVDRADLDARVVLLPDARLCDHVCHESGPEILVQGAGVPDSMETCSRAAADRRHRACRVRPPAPPHTPHGSPFAGLVRDPRGLGPERVRVQIALGDLSDPPSFATRCAAWTPWCISRLRSATNPRFDRGAQRDRHLEDGRSGRARRGGAVRVLLRAGCEHPQPHALPARQGTRRGGRAGLFHRPHRLRAEHHLRAR